MKRGNKTAGLRLRLVLAPDIAIGPGKADLLDGIRDTGSIAAAGRRLGMSYKRAWLLVETMNRCFRSPLVEATKGGSKGGGAMLTPLGTEVLARFRKLEAAAFSAGSVEIDALSALLRDISEEK
ncbi:LysR family transcriptional regulator [Limibaculum sp. M0105]|uniref:LysR family transcriptional regulator n=1 Tax=Thermohalobaculum xanthum TaxID=2753746 RepID=A0A8J7M687_9RHOB|nr:LysR family transcriptional regulator [Thermohalobaculum xanthum]MBK0398838.1 LysR family transcriptional regulator [Thermohalobaculum xanthum]